MQSKRLTVVHQTVNLLKNNYSKIMGRPREFDRVDVLKRATNLFWDRGFEATSMEELVKVTGLNRGSMYSLFKSKEGLFLATIDNYFEFLEATFGVILQQEKGLKTIEEYFYTVADKLVRYGRGCFFANSVIENRSVPQLASDKVDVYYRRVHELLKINLEAAKNNREINPELNLDEVSSYLVCLTQGIAVMSKMSKDSKTIEAVINTALSQIIK